MTYEELRIVLWSAVAVITRPDPDAARFAADFTLTDHTGMVRTEEDFRGRWMLFLFGFANCADICPMGLATIAQVMDDLEARGDAVQPPFITVDPERDTPDALADYVPQFGPGILGLSGSPEQIERTAETLRIYYRKLEQASAPDGYTMGHTSSFLVTRNRDISPSEPPMASSRRRVRARRRARHRDAEPRRRRADQGHPWRDRRQPGGGAERIDHHGCRPDGGDRVHLRLAEPGRRPGAVRRRARTGPPGTRSISAGIFRAARA